MSEALSDLVNPMDIEPDMSPQPHLEVVTQAPERPPHLTPEEAAFALARGPYIGRLAAARSLFRHARAIELEGGYEGIGIDSSFVAGLRQGIVRREAELGQFEREWRWKPESPQSPLHAVPDAEPSVVKKSKNSDWRESALCAQADPEAHFPEKGGSTRAAKKVCLKCEVRDECLEYALENNEHFGIWGGLSEQERRKLKKRRV